MSSSRNHKHPKTPAFTRGCSRLAELSVEQTQSLFLPVALMFFCSLQQLALPISLIFSTWDPNWISLSSQSAFKPYRFTHTLPDCSSVHIQDSCHLISVPGSASAFCLSPGIQPHHLPAFVFLSSWLPLSVCSQQSNQWIPQHLRLPPSHCFWHHVSTFLLAFLIWLELTNCLLPPGLLTSPMSAWALICSPNPERLITEQRNQITAL